MAAKISPMANPTGLFQSVYEAMERPIRDTSSKIESNYPSVTLTRKIYMKIQMFRILGILVRFWSNMGSRGRGRVCKGFLGPVGFNLTEYGPERSHGDPIYA